MQVRLVKAGEGPRRALLLPARRSGLPPVQVVAGDESVFREALSTAIEEMDRAERLPWPAASR